MVSLIEDGVEAGDLFSVMSRGGGGNETGIMGQILDRTLSLNVTLAGGRGSV